MERATAAIEDAGGRPLAMATHDERGFTARKREAYIASVHTGEWAFFCDLDEFAQLKPATVARALAGRRPFIYGAWLDRFAAGGRLGEIDPAQRLEAQFPLAGHVRRNLSYVLAPFAPVSHHPQVCRRGRKKLRRALKIDVHHFKWQGNVVGRLKRRLERIEANGQGDSRWARRVRIQLDYLQAHGGANPHDLWHAGSVLGI